MCQYYLSTLHSSAIRTDEGKAETWSMLKAKARGGAGEDHQEQAEKRIEEKSGGMKN